MQPLILSQIFIYPVKSLTGIAVKSATITPLGLEHDRRWMIVDSKDRFVTQRLYPQLSRIRTSIELDEIILISPDGQRVTLPLTLDKGPSLPVRVWKDTVDSLVMTQEQNKWISRYLGIDCRFVFMPDDSVRQVDQDYACSSSDRVSFADGFPFLLISQASLDNLNQRLQAKNISPVPIQRFRPNLFVDGCQAFAEDNWYSFIIGGNLFHGVKPCSRCIMTTVDPATGTKGREPLDTLLEFRKRGDRAYFGQNIVMDLDFENSLSIKTGDQIQIIESEPGK